MKLRNRKKPYFPPIPSVHRSAAETQAWPFLRCDALTLVFYLTPSFLCVFLYMELDLIVNVMPY